jgi:hypothetical protein
LDEIEAFLKPKIREHDGDERVDVGEGNGDGGVGAGLEREVEKDIARRRDEAGNEAPEEAAGFVGAYAHVFREGTRRLPKARGRT